MFRFFSNNKHDVVALFLLVLIVLFFFVPSFIAKDITGDFITQEVPWYHFTFINLENRILPFWSPYAFSGLPYLFKPELSFFHPFALLTFFLDLIFNQNRTIEMTGQLMELVSILGFCIGAIGVYILSRKILAISPIPSIFAAICYILNPFIIFEMHSTTVMHGVALLPWIIFFLARFLIKPSFSSFLLLIISHYLLFLGYSYHYVYFIIMEFGLVLFYGVKKIPAFFLNIICAFLLSGFFILPYFGIYANSPRNIDNHNVSFHSFASLTPFKILEIINPVSYSTNITQTSISTVFNGPTLTFGTFALIFLFYGIFSLKRTPINFWLIAVFFISLFYSFAGNLQTHTFFGELIPPILKFRFHARVFICVIFVGALLVGLGAQAVLEQRRKKFIEVFLWAFLLLILVGLLLGQLFFLPRINLNLELLKGITTMLLFLFSSLIIVALTIKYRKKSVMIIGLIIMILEYNLFFQNFQYFFTKNITYDQFHKINSLIPETPSNNNLFRMYFEDNQFAYNTSVLNIYNINGYENSPYPGWGERFERYGQIRFYQVSNVKYVVTTTDNWGLGNKDVIKKKTINPLALSKETYFHAPDKLHYVYEIINYLPRFYVPQRIEPCNNTVCLKKEDPPRLVVAKMLSKPINNPSKDVQIKIIDYTTNSIKLLINTPKETFIASSETWDKGWSIEINGTPSTIYDTSNGVRGFIVPAGSSEVKMKYFPPLFIPGIIFTAAGIFILLLIWKYKIFEKGDNLNKFFIIAFNKYIRKLLFKI